MSINIALNTELSSTFMFYNIRTKHINKYTPPKQIVISLYHKLKTYFTKKINDIFFINQKTH